MKDAGKGKSFEFFNDAISAPVVVKGRSIKLYRIPEKHEQTLIQQVLDSSVPEECGVSFIEFNGAAVFVGMLQGKLVPCVTTEAAGEEVDLVAAELQRRLERYSQKHN